MRSHAQSAPARAALRTSAKGSTTATFPGTRRDPADWLAAQKPRRGAGSRQVATELGDVDLPHDAHDVGARSEEHTSELQSRQYLVCRLLLEKKKYKHTTSP